MDALRMSSITYRIATGKSAGRKVVTLQTLPGDDGPLEGGAGKVGGFSLHAGVAAEAHECQKLERLCRYIARPAISEKRLSISAQGTAVRTQDPVEDRASAASEGAASTASVAAQRPSGTTHVEFEPIDFIAKLAALVPPPRAHLTRFHGIFTPALHPSGQPSAVQIRSRRICAPNAKLRAQLTPSGRGKGRPSNATEDTPPAPADTRTQAERRRAMTWAQRLKRVLLRASCPPPFGPAYRLFQIAPGDSGRHRREHLHPLRRCGADRGQH
jgi:hypothetical protein